MSRSADPSYDLPTLVFIWGPTAAVLLLLSYPDPFFLSVSCGNGFLSGVLDMAIRLFSEVLIIFVHFILEHLLPPLAEPTEQYGRVCASCTASTAVQLAGFETLPTSAIAGTSPRRGFGLLCCLLRVHDLTHVLGVHSHTGSRCIHVPLPPIHKFTDVVTRMLLQNAKPAVLSRSHLR